ncbi:site-2 protease family protein [Thermococcus sp. M39]|uniref:site-2 protease family protein n=1 Tax=unclassified Thermococcus TaxID=2627626 RepID=UPI00143C22DF|nr:MULTISPECIES: site-2 protease family protein [unclassified Thermococcus]NJE07781.1 site-2 protease family protein [Thermococcus sp. M39]NJE12336.1 site-2 protease family protein [Thermococcus sp. LS2]
MPKGIYECINCGHREVRDSTEPLVENACPHCGGDMVLVGFTEELEASEKQVPQELMRKIREFYEIGSILRQDANMIAFEVYSIKETNFEKVLKELEVLGYWAALKRRNGKIVLYVFPAQPIKEENPLIGIILFIATLISTFGAGYILSLGYVQTLDQYNLPGIRNIYLNALAFSISIMTILGTHEMGHKIAATLHGVKSTFPYFIPFPSFIGTMGAVIRVKSPIPTRNAAIDLGVSGPLAGFLVALPVSILGLKLSVVVPVSPQEMEGAVYFGTNLLFEIFYKVFYGDIGSNVVLQLHPVAIAGWVGILVTFLNLFPAAQLDGGHIARAFLNEKAHAYLTFGLGFALLVLSYLWVGWLVWGGIILLMGRIGNPGALDEVSPVSTKRKILAVIALMIFILSATPVPLATR